MRNLFFWGVLIFILSSCNQDNSDSVAEGIGQTDVKSLIEANFLPTYTNYYGRDIGSHTFRSASLAVDWTHEYDNFGRLIKSTMYDRYPSRILKEISFSEYSSDNLEMQVKIENIQYFSTFPNIYTEYYSMKLNEDYSLSMIISEEGGEMQTFDELNSQKWVTKLGEVTPTGTKLWTTNYEYDQVGNLTKYYSTYHENYIQDAVVDYTYSNFGDPKSYHFQNEEGNFSIVEYFYREDNTLERLEENFNWGNENAGNNLYRYTEDEAFLEKLTNYEDGSKKVINYDHSEGVIVEKDFGPQGLISNIYTYLLMEEFYFLATHEVYLNGIIESIQFYNSDNKPIKKEFYDNNGDLEYTEYYDEDENVTDTVYE